ncbi:hypothetical protein LX16_4311 [Stackebrandtia albiflava]|uniref:DUF4352 domain-containing protein n=1 Tax=Stackebrandtia albiflava TaxID=406432 RepID=A0A562UR58_9ACTN|nr:hypothetical protein LX16_4311 [Stackebrandtia albiflava]
MTRLTRRTLRRSHRLLLAGVVTAVAVAGCTSNPEDDPDTGQPVESAPPAPADESGDGGVVEVAETGHSLTEDSAGDVMVTYAVIVENTSADVAIGTNLDIRLLDSAGEPVTDEVTGNDRIASTVNLVMPGERQAVTNTTYIDGDDVASLEVTVDGSRWLPAGDARAQAVEVSEVTVAGDGDTWEIDFRVDSPYAEELTSVATYAVYRDAGGAVVGGSAPNDSRLFAYPSGTGEGQIEVSSASPDWEPGNTEVYIDPSVTL